MHLVLAAVCGDAPTQQVEYHDGDREQLELQSERVRVQLGACEFLATTSTWRPGDVVWAVSGKGCPPWPALVVTPLDIADNPRGGTPVQFFGSHEFAWVPAPQRLEDGLHAGLHMLKSGRYATLFDDALYELRCYLKACWR